MRSAWPVKSPWEKLSRAMFSPARMRRSSISGDSEAGTIVATILFLWSGSVIAVPAAAQHDNGSWTYRVARRFQFRFVSGFDDVVGAPPRGVDDAPPPGRTAVREPAG